MERLNIWQRGVAMEQAVALSIQEEMPSGPEEVLGGRFERREIMSLSEHRSGLGLGRGLAIWIAFLSLWLYRTAIYLCIMVSAVPAWLYTFHYNYTSVRCGGYFRGSSASINRRKKLPRVFIRGTLVTSRGCIYIYPSKIIILFLFCTKRRQHAPWSKLWTMLGHRNRYPPAKAVCKVCWKPFF